MIHVKIHNYLLEANSEMDTLLKSVLDTPLNLTDLHVAFDFFRTPSQLLPKIHGTHHLNPLQCFLSLEQTMGIQRTIRQGVSRPGYHWAVFDLENGV